MALQPAPVLGVVILHHGRMCRLQVLGGAQSSVDLVRQLQDLGLRIAANLVRLGIVMFLIIEQVSVQVLSRPAPERTPCRANI